MFKRPTDWNLKAVARAILVLGICACAVPASTIAYSSAVKTAESAVPIGEEEKSESVSAIHHPSFLARRHAPTVHRPQNSTRADSVAARPDSRYALHFAGSRSSPQRC